jgi:hypothetical protein
MIPPGHKFFNRLKDRYRGEDIFQVDDCGGTLPDYGIRCTYCNTISAWDEMQNTRQCKHCYYGRKRNRTIIRPATLS